MRLLVLVLEALKGRGCLVENTCSALDNNRGDALGGASAKLLDKIANLTSSM